jgi:hypothetical protein
MRSIIFPAAALAALLLAASAPAQDAGTTTTLPANVPEETIVEGKVPDGLAGRWMAVCHAKLPSGQVRPFARLFEIKRGPQHLEMAVRRAYLPPEVDEKMNIAAGLGTPGRRTPGPGRPGRQWTRSRPRAARTTMRTRSSAPTPIPELKSEEAVKDAPVAVSATENFTGVDRVARIYTLLGIREITPTVLKGGCMNLTLAIALVPIPIVLRGEAQIYRLGAPPVPERSFLERLLDTFTGCGRK